MGRLWVIAASCLTAGAATCPARAQAPSGPVQPADSANTATNSEPLPGPPGRETPQATEPSPPSTDPTPTNAAAPESTPPSSTPAGSAEEGATTVAQSPPRESAPVEATPDEWTPSASALDDSSSTHIVTLRDGQVLHGRLLRQTPKRIVLQLQDGTPLELPQNVVQSVEEQRFEEGEHWPRDPNISRYLYSPSAFSLGSGNAYVAQRAIVITSAGLGVTDFFDLEVGTVLPLLFADTPVVVGGAKLGVPVSDDLSLGAGVQAFLVADVVAGFAFANATLGSHDSHVTLTGGGAIEFTAGDLGAGIAALSASHRLGASTALITENWFFYFPSGDGPWNGPLFVLPSGGVRLFGTQYAVDLALVPVITLDSDVPVVPLPWLSFAWNWTVDP